MSAPLSDVDDVEPSTTATRPRAKHTNAPQPKTKRSYQTVDPVKRK